MDFQVFTEVASVDLSVEDGGWVDQAVDWAEYMLSLR